MIDPNRLLAAPKVRRSDKTLFAMKQIFAYTDNKDDGRVLRTLVYIPIDIHSVKGLGVSIPDDQDWQVRERYWTRIRSQTK